jgi:hypothetical protein
MGFIGSRFKVQGFKGSRSRVERFRVVCSQIASKSE